MHWSKRTRIKKRLAAQVALELRYAGYRLPDTPAETATIHITRYSKKAPDHDNLVASAKPLLDALQPVTAHRSYGLGLIADDSPECVTLICDHVLQAQSETRIRMELSHAIDTAHR